MKREMLYLQALCGLLTLLVLDNGVMFFFFALTTAVSWVSVIWLTKRKNFAFSRKPFIRFMIPVGSFGLAALFAFLVQR